MALTQIKTTGIADNAVTDAKVVDAITSSNHLTLSGGTMTGALNMNSQNITNAGTIQGTLSTASQTSITSVGSLSGLTIAGAGVNASPNLAIDNSSSSSYIHSIEALGANMTQGQTNIINLGKIGDAKNSGVIGYKWDSAGSNNNLLTFEHWGTGALVTINGLGTTVINSTGANSLNLFRSDSGTVAQFGCTTVSDDADIYLRTNGVFNFHTPGSGQIRFSSGGSQALNLDASQNASFSGQAQIKEGASNALSLAFSNDTDTGIYRGGDGATAFVQNGGIALELQSSLTAEFRGLIKQKGTSDSDYGNTAFETRAGNNSQGLKISHGGGNGKLELFGGNQSRTQFYANQITANVNGLEIKTTDAQSLTLGTNNSTRVTLDSSGNASFAEKILMTKESVIQQVADETKGFMFNGGGGTTFGFPNVQGSGLYGMVFGREAITADGGGQNIAKSHWGGISIIGFSGSGVQGIDIVAWGYGNGGATVLKGGNWVGSLYRSYSTVNYHLVVDVGTDVTMFSILIGI